MLRRGKMAFFQGTGKKNGFLRSIFTSPLLTAWEAQNLVSRAVRTREDARARIQSARNNSGTVSDQSTDGGVNVTTVTHLKVLVVDGARVAPTPKPKKRKKGAEDGDGDDDDEPAAAAKKARVVEGDETDDG